MGVFLGENHEVGLRTYPTPLMVWIILVSAFFSNLLRSLICLGVKIIIPHMFHYHGLGNHLAGIAHHIFEKSKLAGL